MKKILVPFDFTATAELGLRLAAEIAKRCQATLSIVNFTQHPYTSTFSATGDITKKTDPATDLFTIDFLRKMNADLEALASQYASQGITTTFAIVDNEYKNGIDEYLKSESIDLIVMGTSGEENAKETFTGNHTEQTIRVSACPVLSVRDNFNVDDLKTIVVGVDVITDNKMADGLAGIKAIADCFESTVHLVHFRDKKRDNTLLLDEYFNKIASIANITNYQVHVLEADDVAEGLSAYADEHQAGLIAIIKNQREGIFRIFSRPIASKLIKEEGRPVVTVKL